MGGGGRVAEVARGRCQTSVAGRGRGAGRARLTAVSLVGVWHLLTPVGKSANELVSLVGVWHLLTTPIGDSVPLVSGSV
jgi:hypothetical protein